VVIADDRLIFQLCKDSDNVVCFEEAPSFLDKSVEAIFRAKRFYVGLARYFINYFKQNNDAMPCCVLST